MQTKDCSGIKLCYGGIHTVQEISLIRLQRLIIINCLKPFIGISNSAPRGHLAAFHTNSVKERDIMESKGFDQQSSKAHASEAERWNAIAEGWHRWIPMMRA